MSQLFTQLLNLGLPGESHRGIRRSLCSLAGVQELVKFFRCVSTDDAVKAGALIVLLLMLEALRQ
jgi:hypothetical protein